MNPTYIDEVLSFDPIATAEKMSGGKHWSEFDDSENALSLALAMMSGEAKRNALKQSGDTHSGMEWDEFKTLIKSHGFKCALEYDIHHDDDKVDEAVIYYDDNGFVIWATSYWGKKSVNGGTLYGQLEKHQDFSRSEDLMHSSNGFFSDNKLYFSFDVREGLFHNLAKATAHASPLKTWEGNEFLWFVDYAEDDKPGYDYKAITKSKILRCPAELQDIVRVCFA